MDTRTNVVFCSAVIKPRRPGGVRDCRYDGEFFAGFAHGLGVYTKQNGKMYKGEFTYGKRHGCVV